LFGKIGAMRLYIGSYGSGVRCFDSDAQTGDLSLVSAADVPDPSFLAWHPSREFMYAACEGTASITALRVLEDGSLTVLNAEPTGGASPCHVAVDPEGRVVVAANYADGKVSVHPLLDDGSVGAVAQVIQHEGSGPNAGRQAGPHAHMASFSPYPRTFLVTDLGTDSVITYRLDDEGKASVVHTASLTPGSGPRHIAFGPNGSLYLSCELDSTVDTGEIRAGSLVRSVQRHPATVGAPSAENFPSHLEVRDGFVYVANRGANCVSVFRASPWQPVQDVPCGGDWPRHFAIAGPWLYVANQNSGTITASYVDNGVPGEFRVVAEVPGASCVLI
jgi:6-phosphogluconolactonase